MGLSEQGAPLFVEEVERGLFLFPWRPEERDSSLAGQVLQRKRGPIEYSSRLLEKLGEPRAAEAADGSLK